MALTKLGNPDAAADGVLEAFDVDDTALEIVLDCSEFTCRCPVTAQPDWATIEIRYRPGPKVVETKSLKLYLETFREVGIFHEHVANRVLDDFVRFVKPRSAQLTGLFNPRGGISTTVTVRYPLELKGR